LPAEGRAQNGSVDLSKVIVKKPIMIYEHKSTPEKD
jgi:hypothetical protein